MIDVESIRSQWNPRPQDREATVAVWDSMADDFGDHEIPSFDDDQLLGIFEQHGMLGPDVDALDIACGTGAHSIAIAGRVRSTTGIDISPAMIARAEARTRSMRLGNVTFIAKDWSEIDLDSSEMAGRYDLVFAHMTPAIDSTATFEKLSRASRGWCLLAKPIRRHDAISEGLHAALGIEHSHEGGVVDIQNGFNLLWQQGLHPRLDYREDAWTSERTLEQAQLFYTTQLRNYRELADDSLPLAGEYLRSVADADGLIRNATDATVATLYWHV